MEKRKSKKKITNNNQTYANMNQKTNSNLCMNLKSDAKVGGFSLDSK